MVAVKKWQPYGDVNPAELNRLANRLLSATALIMFVPLAGSLARVSATGWLFIYTFQLALYGTTLLFFLFRNLIGTRVKAGYLIFAYYLIPAAGIYSLGQLKGGVMYLPVAIVIAVFYFGPRLVAWLAVISSAWLSYVAMIYITGRKTPAISLEVANTSIPQWANFGFSFIAFFAMFAIVMFGYRNILAVKVEETEKQRDEILQLKNYDQLTGLGTLALALEYLSSVLEQAKQSGTSGALLLVRIENLEETVDSCGFEAGDGVLKEAGARISSLLRPGDMLARASGRRFLVIIPELKDTERAEFLARMIHESFARPLPPLFPDAGELVIRCQIGITLFPCDDMTADQLVQRANTARFSAKKNDLDTYLLE